MDGDNDSTNNQDFWKGFSIIIRNTGLHAWLPLKRASENQSACFTIQKLACGMFKNFSVPGGYDVGTLTWCLSSTFETFKIVLDCPN